MPSILFRCKYFVKNLEPIMSSMLLGDKYLVKMFGHNIHSLLFEDVYCSMQLDPYLP